MTDLSKKLTAEFLGTCALVFVGAGAVIMESHTGMSHLGVPDGKVGLTGIAVAHGGILAAMIYALGSISGGHFNPAVSLAVFIRRELDGRQFLSYVGVQLAGALVAALCLAGLFPDEVLLAALGTPSFDAKLTMGRAFAVEAAITFILTMVILYTTRRDNTAKQLAGVAIGLTLTALIFFAGPLTGAGANPARYLGPALVSSNLSQFLAYTFGPLGGGALAALVFGFLWAPEGTQPKLARVEPAPGGHEGDPGLGEALAEGDAVGWGSNQVLLPETPKTVVESTSLEPKETVRRAYELYEQGDGEAAVFALVPLLARFEELSRDIVNRVRTLVIVIEEEHGRMGHLDAFRHLVYPSQARAHH